MKEFFFKIFEIHKTLKALILCIIDFFLIIFSSFLSLSIIKSQVAPFSKSIILYCILVAIFYLPISYLFNNYNSINRLFDLKNIINLLKASLLTTVILLIISNLSLFRFLYLENILIQNIILFFFILNFRLVLKIILNYKKDKKESKKRCIIYGAGETGSYIFENSSAFQDYDIICFVDDNLKKRGRYLKNLRIYHSSELQEIISNYKIDKLFIAILNLSTFQREKIYENLKNLTIDYEYLELGGGIKSLEDIKFSIKSENDRILKDQLTPGDSRQIEFPFPELSQLKD